MGLCTNGCAQLYDAGARNIAILNVPPIDRSPGSLKMDPAYRKIIAKAVGEINWRLLQMVKYFNKNHPDTKMFYFDTNYVFTIALDKPSSFAETQGLKEVKTFCTAYQGWVTMDLKLGNY